MIHVQQSGIKPPPLSLSSSLSLSCKLIFFFPFFIYIILFIFVRLNPLLRIVSSRLASLTTPQTHKYIAELIAFFSLYITFRFFLSISLSLLCFLSFANCSRSYISYRIYVSFGNEQDETQSFATPCFIFFNKTSVHLSGNRNSLLFSQSENTAAALQVFNYFFLLRILSVGFNYFVPFVYWCQSFEFQLQCSLLDFLPSARAASCYLFI